MFKVNHNFMFCFVLQLYHFIFHVLLITIAGLISAPNSAYDQDIPVVQFTQAVPVITITDTFQSKDITILY